MKIQIIKPREKPKWGKVKMKCDEKLSEKLDKYPLIRDNMNSYKSSTAIQGVMGQGKTSWVINMLTKVFKKCFNYIYFFFPPNSRASVPNSFWEKLDEDQMKIYDELTEDNLRDVYERCQHNASNGETSLIIFDDVQEALQSNMKIVKALNKIITEERHIKTVCWILLQNYYALHLKTREILDNIVFYKPSKKQAMKLFSEVAEMSEEQFLHLLEVIFQEPHDWCFIGRRSKKIYRCFDEIRFTDDDDEEDDKVEEKEDTAQRN